MKKQPDTPPRIIFIIQYTQYASFLWHLHQYISSRSQGVYGRSRARRRLYLAAMACNEHDFTSTEAAFTLAFGWSVW